MHPSSAPQPVAAAARTAGPLSTGWQTRDGWQSWRNVGHPRALGWAISHVLSLVELEPPRHGYVARLTLKLSPCEDESQRVPSVAFIYGVCPVPGPELTSGCIS